MRSKDTVANSMFGSNSVKNQFTAVDRTKRAYYTLLETHRSMIKADYGDRYTEDIDAGKFGVARFLTIIGLLGYRPNTVGTVIEGTGRDNNGPPHYVFGCPDMVRPDNMFNIFVRCRTQAQDDISSLAAFLGVMVEGMGLNLDSFFPEVSSVETDKDNNERVSFRTRVYPITYIALCPITGINSVHILGVSDKSFLHASDTELISKLKDTSIKPEDKINVLDIHFEKILTDFVRSLYNSPKICEADPLDIFSNHPQSIFGMMLGGVEVGAEKEAVATSPIIT